MATSATWTGILPAVTTKFTADDRLDVPEMERCWRMQIDAGVDGLILAGSLGEASTLDAEEKLALIPIAKRVADGKPVLLTICDGSTRAAARLAEQAARAGADGFMLLPGLPYKSDPRETMAHLRAVARAGAKPAMVYINPVAYGVDITPEMLVELADEPQFWSVKESSDNVRRVTDIINLCGARYKIFTGVDNLALESALMGADGWVAGLIAAFPAESVALWRHAKAGRIAEALAIYRWFRPLLDVDVSTRLVQNIKLVEALAIGSNDRCRAPRLALAGAERERIAGIVRTAMATRPRVL